MKVLVGMSGGVDSSVAACILKDAGYEVIGATMSIWDKNQHYGNVSHKDACFSPHEEEDIAEARAICAQLDIPYHVIDCTAEYQKLVLTNFKEEYMAGRTPNPCVMCNSMIKFEALPRAARAAGIEFDRFATGHYARVSFDAATSRYRLQRAVDTKKDQSYFLYRLKQEQLAGILLPVGEYDKEHVRQIARSYGLKVSEKPDSQDFYAGDINDILQAEPKIGNFVDKTGKVLGQHRGIWNFTIGQRKGLGISADRPLYVIGLNKERNEVILGYDEDGYQTSLTASRLNWVSIPPLTEKQALYAKLRSSQQPVDVCATPLDNDLIRIDFIEQQKAVAAGQSVVLYDREGFVLGGGVINGKS